MLGQDHYIYRLRAACIRQPQWNRHQLAALDRELSLSLSAASLEDYLRASGNLIGLARATALDRAANAHAIALRTGDPWAAAAAVIEYQCAQRGDTHAGLYANITEGHAPAVELRAISAEVFTTFSRLLHNLILFHTSNYEIEPIPSAIRNAVAVLSHLDPAFTQETWLSQPRYSRRLPWQAGKLQEWLQPFWPSQSVATALPAIAGLSPAVVQWGAVSWPEVEPLDVPPPVSLAGAYIDRQALWPHPLLADHWRETQRQLAEACSPIARYAVAGQREALWNIESARHTLEWAILLAPLRAIANHGWQREESSRAAIDKALATLHAFTGHTLATLLSSPQIQSFLDNNLFPHLANPTELGAMDGEAGFDLLRHARLWRDAGGVVEFRV